MEPRCPRGLRTGGLDSGGERGQTPICVSVVWKSRSHQLRRRGGKANWEVVGAASSLQSAARLLKSRRASRYLVPPDAPTEGHEGHEGGMEVEEGGGWVSPSGCVCARWTRSARRYLQGEASCCGAWPASQFGPHTVAESGHEMEKDSKKKKRSVMVRGGREVPSRSDSGALKFSWLSPTVTVPNPRRTCCHCGADGPDSSAGR